MPVSNILLCLYPQRQSLTVNPENFETKLLAIRYLHKGFGFRVDSTVGAIHSPLVHEIEAFVSHPGKTQAPYHTQCSRA
jgi:hypothetical protein